MRSYAEQVFPASFMALHEKAVKLVAALPDGDPVYRCHEVVRAVMRCLGTSPGVEKAVVDGRYGAVEHSWIELRTVPVNPTLTRVAILDTCAVGSLPPVQLIDMDTMGLPQRSAFKRGEPRTDIRDRTLSKLWGSIRDMLEE